LITVCDAKGMGCDNLIPKLPRLKRNSASSTPVDHFTCVVCLVNLRVVVEARGKSLSTENLSAEHRAGTPGSRVSASAFSLTAASNLHRHLPLKCSMEDVPSVNSSLRNSQYGRVLKLQLKPASQEYSTKRRTVDHLINN
jgi:hypothetical protein